ncbi:hypothetical protein [Carboxylicivirga sp. M1479]|uniref:glucosamine inositolphosphorylceramide transferase family protein n=1 Tax=Carboxylicivirga sp. M1479 TaxID=2594476 RepID=UPI001177F81E|nr:hypothetical protein [Carboxylicivirga sp. M1479]TRX66352.1 hypothetical protein FNN09_14190 [Carboxylicivirga sp. M1479]
MSIQKLSLISKKENVGKLLMVIDATVPSWLVDVIVVLANLYPSKEISLIINEEKSTDDKFKWFLSCFIFLERYIFRQRFKNFNSMNIYDVKFPSSIGLKPYSHEALDELEADDLIFNLTKIKIDKYSRRVVSVDGVDCAVGTTGIISFVDQYMKNDRALIVRSHQGVIWKHLFQTKEYSLDKNIGFFKAALKQAIECLWVSERQIVNEQESPTDNNNSSLETYWLRWVLKRLFKWLCKTVFFKRWIVLLKLPDGRVKRLKPTSHNGWADPFLVQQNLFVEEIDNKSGKGHLAQVQLDENGDCVTAKSIVNEPFHLSYPNIFKYNNEWLMVPESASAKQLRLYKSNFFPQHWNLSKVLVDDARLLDTTLFLNDGFWWIFATVKVLDEGSSFDQLFLFYTKDLLNGNWKPHKQNPVITNSSQARPAGKIYRADNRIYRPSQDCFANYGAAVNINEIVALTTSEYKEQLIKRLTPLDYGVKGLALHTFNFDNGWEVLDLQLWSPRFPS